MMPSQIGASSPYRHAGEDAQDVVRWIIRRPGKNIGESGLRSMWWRSPLPAFVKDICRAAALFPDCFLSIQEAWFSCNAAVDPKMRCSRSQLDQHSCNQADGDCRQPEGSNPLN